MGKLGFMIDLSLCTGCATCQVACKDLHDSPIRVNFRRVSTYETGTFPKPGVYHFSIACNHCEKPACVANCPTEAMHFGDDGTVQHDDDLCIGCKTCVESCPYGAPQFDASLNIVQKCDSCAARREEGQNPVCVDACRNRCLQFGDIDELRAAAGTDSEKLVSDIAILPDSSEATPSLLIKAKDICFLDDYRENPL